MDVLWATEAILNGRRIADFASLEALAEQDLGAVFELGLYQADVHAAGGARTASAPTHLATTPERVAGSRRAGAYCGLVALIRGSGRLLRRGHRRFLPEDRVARLSNETPIPDLAAALAPIVASMEQDVASLRSTLEPDLAGLPVSTRIRVRLADALLAELRESGYSVADQHITLTPLRKLWIAWRESRRYPQT
jgi:phytoene synthase